MGAVLFKYLIALRDGGGLSKRKLQWAKVVRLKCSLMPRTLLVLLVLAIASLPVVAEEIPFRFTDGFICIDARMEHGGEPVSFVLDSGAGVSVLSLRTARRLKLKLGAAENVRGVGSEAAAYRLEPVRALAGGSALPAIPMAVDLSMADELCSRPVDGLIGVDFFEGRVVQIDYVHRCLRLMATAAPTTKGQKLPIEMKNGVMCVPVGVNDSQPRWTRLDTGCNDSLHWVVPRPRERGGRAGVSIGFVTNPKDTSLMSVTLGSRTVESVKTSLHGRALFEGEAGLLGNGLLSQFVVTVDRANRQVILEEAPR